MKKTKVLKVIAFQSSLFFSLHPFFFSNPLILSPSKLPNTTKEFRRGWENIDKKEKKNSLSTSMESLFLFIIKNLLDMENSKTVLEGFLEDFDKFFISFFCCYNL
jgi:hypothetical protein